MTFGYLIPAILTVSFVAITVAGWPLATRIERALSATISILTVAMCAVVY